MNVVVDIQSIRPATAGAQAFLKAKGKKMLIGGYKDSGWSRVSDAQAVANYLETKSVCMVV